MEEVRINAANKRQFPKRRRREVEWGIYTNLKFVSCYSIIQVNEKCVKAEARELGVGVFRAPPRDFGHEILMCAIPHIS